MLNGEPYISQASVADALDTLIYPSKAVEPNPLERLLLVDLFIANPDLPKGEHLREFALHHILLDLIVMELSAKRELLDLLPPPENERLGDAEVAIEEAGRSRNAELLLWTLLHYRYVRADLSIDPERMSRLVSVNSRSLRRYFHYALRLLTRLLLREEWAVRVEHHRRKLFAALPCGVPIKLTGRDTQLELAWEALTTRPPCRIYVTGTTGIGKTCFSEALLQRLIDAGGLDHVIWLTSPPSCEYVRRSVADALLSSQGNFSLRDYVLRFPTALVLDNAEDLLAQPEQVTEMLRGMSAVVVVLTSSVYTPLLEVDLHLPLPELDEASVYTLVRESPHLGELLVEDVASWIWENVGGNPLAVKIAMALMSFEEMGVIREQAAEETIGKAFERLSEEARLCCCALSLLPSATLTELQSLWHREGLQEALSELVRFFLAEQSNGMYRLATSAATYVRQQYIGHRRIQGLFQHLLNSMSKQAHRAVYIVEQVLLHKWDSAANRIQWITDFWKTGLAHGHFAQWCAIFEANLPDLSPELWMAYGVCLRRAGQWDAAHHALHHASHECGLKGDFSAQSEALLEWATLARFQGDYTKAIALLEQAERCNVLRDKRQFDRIQYERSQIALDKGDGQAALESLHGLARTVDTEVLLSETLLLLGECDDCRTTALHLLKLINSDRRVEASLYTLIGRSYTVEGQCDAAVSYFSLALTILEQSEDVSAIARAQANLAGALLNLGKMQRAQELLERAKPVLAMLEDTIGYHAAMHNQRLTDIYRTRLI